MADSYLHSVVKSSANIITLQQIKSMRTHELMLRPAKKIGVVVLILVQFARLFGVATTVYFIYNAIGTGGSQVGAFDETQPMGPGGIKAGGDSVNYTDPETSYPDYGSNDTIYSIPSTDKSITTSAGAGSSQGGISFKEWLLLCVPTLEVSMSLVITCLVMGPLSPKVSFKRWIMWLFKMRVFWMRFVWTLTGATYACIYVMNRKLLHQQTQLVKFLDSNMVKCALAVTVIEYGCLGMVESIVKLIKVETIENRLRKHDSSIRGFWKKMCMFGYYMCLLAYAFRSFSMSLYFGILSVVNSASNTKLVTVITLPPEMNALSFAEQMRAEEEIRRKLTLYGAIVVVLQIYLAIIRGKFYGFFMHNLLSHFLYEANHDYFQADLRTDEKPKKCNETANETPPCECEHRDRVVDFY